MSPIELCEECVCDLDFLNSDNLEINIPEIYVATMNGHPECLNHAIKINSHKNLYDQLIKELKQSVELDYVPCAEILIKNMDDNVWNSSKLLFHIISNSQYQMLDLFIANNVNLDIQDDIDKATPLMLSIYEEDLICMKKLINAGASLEIKDYYRRTALQRAIAYNITKAIEELINYGADYSEGKHYIIENMMLKKEIEELKNKLLGDEVVETGCCALM